MNDAAALPQEAQAHRGVLTRGVGDQEVALEAAAAADLALAERPLRAGLRDAGARVRLVPVAAPGQYIARSTMIGAVAVIDADTSLLGRTEFTGIVVRLCAGSVGVDVTTSPPGSRYRIVAVTGDAFGLASSRNVEKNEPVAPSATNHVVCGAGTAAASCPPFQTRPF